MFCSIYVRLRFSNKHHDTRHSTQPGLFVSTTSLTLTGERWAAYHLRTFAVQSQVANS
ncbi:hypothetical protein M404DRAFT_993225 [Pisolithus tinctorius Marx 270]|uniref:Uncharacterized protein n=1 Tax=Pisolithus tinctorius Marx 270 TaxID=870435 RepID=A0A0C3KVQ8_PISTI|nr:hypothetical protein M404DRAFT_993225 [Pisolithus tinctorius Marx 270]